MPQRTQRVGKSVVHMLFLTAALSLLSALVRRERKQLVLTARDRRKKVRVAPRRIAVSLAFATLFFAGAALSAGAGNSVVQLIDPTTESAPAADTTTTTDVAPATVADEQPPPAEQQPPPAEQQPPAEDPQPTSSDTEQAAEVDPPDAPQPTSQAPADTVSSTHLSGVRSALSARVRSGLAKPGTAATARPGSLRSVPTRFFRPKVPPVIKAQPLTLRKPVDREPEADEPNVAATVWLYRKLPDPTPPSRRLKPSFARRLARISARNHVDWALTLALLRARGDRGSVPASKPELLTLTKELAARHANRGAWSSVLALAGRTSFADRTIALKNLYRAVGLQALVKGFDWAKPHLEKKVLHDKRISIYPGGRSDIERGRVNVRVLALIAYLAEAHGQVTVSCLISGHRLYARPGVVSAHIYGLAADISMLGGISILGHQQPDGSITERAVRNILLLPAEMQPRQVISLLGLGGPSFPLANHYDHIHVGY
jgi:hypothetical protein